MDFTNLTYAFIFIASMAVMAKSLAGAHREVSLVKAGGATKACYNVRQSVLEKPDGGREYTLCYMDRQGKYISESFPMEGAKGVRVFPLTAAFQAILFPASYFASSAMLLLLFPPPPSILPALYRAAMVFLFLCGAATVLSPSGRKQGIGVGAGCTLAILSPILFILSFVI